MHLHVFLLLIFVHLIFFFFSISKAQTTDSSAVSVSTEAGDFPSSGASETGSTTSVPYEVGNVLITTAASVEKRARNDSTATTDEPLLQDQPHESNDEESSTHNFSSVTMKLLNNSDFLYLDFTPKQNMLEIGVRLNKTLVDDLLGQMKSPEVEIKSFTPVKLDLGFDYGSVVDVVSVPLGQVKATGDVTGSDKKSKNVKQPDVQDLHWSKRDGILIPDTVQNYQLLSSDVTSNGSFISVNITRHWLTCDDNDIQFTLDPVAVYWNLDYGSAKSKKVSPKAAEQNAGSETSTPAIASSLPSSPTMASDASTISAVATNLSAASEGLPVTTPASNVSTSLPVNSTTATESDVEVLRSIEDLNFRGPVLLNMAAMLRNVTAVLLQSCHTMDVNQGKRKLAPLYNCTIEEYDKRKHAKSLLRVYGLATLPHPGTRGPNSGPTKRKSFFAEHDFLPCPSAKEFQDISNLLSRPLLGGDARRKGKSNDWGRESENGGSQFTVTNLIVYYILFMSMTFMTY